MSYAPGERHRSGAPVAPGKFQAWVPAPDIDTQDPAVQDSFRQLGIDELVGSGRHGGGPVCSVRPPLEPGYIGSCMAHQRTQPMPGRLERARASAVGL